MNFDFCFLKRKRGIAGKGKSFEDLFYFLNRHSAFYQVIRNMEKVIITPSLGK